MTKSADKPAKLSEVAPRPDPPTTGEQGGRFYFTLSVGAQDDSEIPENIHHDNAVQVRLQANNQGWDTTDQSYLVDQASFLGDHWTVLYSVPVQRNRIDIP